MEISSLLCIQTLMAYFVHETVSFAFNPRSVFHLRSAQRPNPFSSLPFSVGCFRARSCQPALSIASSRMTSGDESASSSWRFVDIGANIMDERYTLGSYRGKVRHAPDWDDVLDRASQAGMKHVIVTAGTLEESRAAVAKVREFRLKKGTDGSALQLYCTVGVHPTRCLQEFEERVDDARSPEQIMQELKVILQDGKQDGVVVAAGEFGLDYDRLEFCPKDVQHRYFLKQLALFEGTSLPLFLHNRSVGTDLYEILLQHRQQWKTGVVHSFDDTLELANKFIDLGGIFLGLNGCSLRTEENLEVVRQLPLDKLLLETDCPYCDVRRTHPGYQFVKTHFESRQEKKFEKGIQVKGRNEPANIVHVAEVIAGVKGIPLSEVVDTCYQNSLSLYGWES